MKAIRKSPFRHLACIAIALMFLFGNICGALAGPSEKVTVSMDLQVKNNLILAKYGAALYVDNERLDLVANGGRLIRIIEVTPGIHTFTLRAQKSGVPDMSFDIYVADHTTLSATIQTHRKYIKINNMVLKTGSSTIEYDENTTDWADFVPLLLYFALVSAEC